MASAHVAIASVVLLLVRLGLLSLQSFAPSSPKVDVNPQQASGINPRPCNSSFAPQLWSLRRHLRGAQWSKAPPLLDSRIPFHLSNSKTWSGAAHQRARARFVLEKPASDMMLVAPSAGKRVVSTILNVNVERPVSVTADNFICVTMDWWPQEKCDYGVCSWGNTSVLSQNLSSPLLRSALTALQPMFRIGGSLQDHIVYNTSAHVKCRPMVWNETEIFRFSGGCLTMERWDEFYAFAHSSRAQIVFGLNGLYGRNRTGLYSYEGDWDPSNARGFLDYSIRAGYDLMGVELGNEIGGSNGIAAKLSPAQYAHDVRTLRMVVDELYAPGSPSQLACLNKTGRSGPLCARKPLIVAPDNIEVDGPWFLEFVHLLEGGTAGIGTLGSGTHTNGTLASRTQGNRTVDSGTVGNGTTGSGARVLDGLSHHLYSMGAGVEPRVEERMLDPAYHDGLNALFARARAVKAAAPPGTQLWMGEAGGAFNSGRPNASDAFMSGFWFLHELGSTARSGYDVYCRQTLIGGNYGLLRKDALSVAPDLWAAILFNRLMGPRVLGVNASAPDVRAFAHCLKGDVRGDVALVLINYSNDTTYQISHGLGKSSNASNFLPKVGGAIFREEYHFTAGDGGRMHSKVSLLNGFELRPFDNGTLPEMLPRVVLDQEALQLGPWSYAFVALRGVNVTACQG